MPAGDGWALCDGEDGTPDLRDRFVVGSGATYVTGDNGEGTSELSVETSCYGTGTCGVPTPSGRLAVESVSGGGGTPPFFALAYIMKL